MDGIENNREAKEEEPLDEANPENSRTPTPLDEGNGHEAVGSAAGRGPAGAATAAAAATATTGSDRIKVTMSFMKTYTAMRGSLGVQHTPLFEAARRQDCDNVHGESDEVKMLKEANLAITEDGLGRADGARRFPDDSTERQTTFYFAKPECRPLRLEEVGIQDRGDDVIADHALDHDALDQGWLRANGPFSDDDEDSLFVSDDEGDPAESRIAPATFRALVAGCQRNNVDDLRVPVPAAQSLRPVTPKDKILNWAGHDRRVTAFERCRQFDMDDGDELSPAYRVEQQGPARSVLWTPPGVTPERVFVMGGGEGEGGGGDGGLLLQQQQPIGELFHRMAPLQYQELRRAVFANPSGGQGAPARILLSSSPSSSSSLSSSSSSSFSSPPALPPALPPASPSVLSPPRATEEAKKKKKKKKEKKHHKEEPLITTFGWSDVHDAVARNQRYHRSRHHRQDMEEKIVSSSSTSLSSSPSSSSSSSSSSAASPSSPILQALRSGWRAVRAKQAEDARLAETNARIQAALTSQARRLATLEHQIAAYNQAREVTRQQEEAERRRARRKQRRIAQAVGAQLQDLQLQVRQADAAVEQGRAWRGVLARRLRDGEARLARLCRRYGAADAEALSGMLARELEEGGGTTRPGEQHVRDDHTGEA